MIDMLVDDKISKIVWMVLYHHKIPDSFELSDTQQFPSALTYFYGK